MITTYFKTINNKKLFVKRINGKQKSPTLVFLHEALGSVEQWQAFPEELCQATGLSGMLYDRQGHGKSAPMTSKRTTNYLNIEALDFLPKLLMEEKIDNPILVGHSDGGTIALIYAANFKNTKGIIVEAAHIEVEPITIKGIQTTIRFIQLTRLKEKLAKYHGSKTDDLFEAWTSIWLSEAFSDWNVKELLPKIACPSLVIQGKKDQYATEQQFHTIVMQLKEQSEHLLIENCGHTPHKEAKEMVLKEICECLEKWNLLKE